MAREGAGQAADQRAGGARRYRGPPAEPAEQRAAQGQQRRPATAGDRRIEQHGPAVIAVTLTGRPYPLIDQGGGAVGHGAEPLPGCGAQRMAGHVSLHRRQHPELGDEALVVRGELTADARRKRVPEQFPLEEACGFPPPLIAFREPREGAARHELSRGLGDDVVVGRRAPALEPVQVLLMPPDLLHCELVVIEQAVHAGPVVQQAPDPDQADQPDTNLDAAGPVHAGQKGIFPVPGPQLIGNPACVGVVASKEPGRGQEREVLQAGNLPDLLDVADAGFRALVDPERVAIRRRPVPGDRIVEPVGRHQVGPGDAQHLPLPPHEPVRRGQDGFPGLLGNLADGTRRQDRGEPACAGQRRKDRGKLLGLNLTA